MEINESISISQSPKTIWDFWMQVSNDVQWRDGFIKAEWTSLEPYGVGSTGVHYHKDLGAFVWEVTKIEDGHFFEFVHREGRLKGSTAFFQVDPENGGSLVTVRAKMSGPFFMRLMMPFMRGMMIKSMKADLQRLKEVLEISDDQR